MGDIIIDSWHEETIEEQIERGARIYSAKGLDRVTIYEGALNAWDIWIIYNYEGWFYKPPFVQLAELWEHVFEWEPLYLKVIKDARRIG